VKTSVVETSSVCQLVFWNNRITVSVIVAGLNLDFSVRNKLKKRFLYELAILLGYIVTKRCQQ